MAKRNELGSLLGGLNPGNARGCEDDCLWRFGLWAMRFECFPLKAESYRAQRPFVN
jgi:hypothetical protein